MEAARARSRELYAMDCMASTSGITLCCLMSMCWMGEVRSSFFVGIALLSIAKQGVSAWLISAVERGQQRHQQVRQLCLRALACLHYFMVVNRLIQDAGS